MEWSWLKDWWRLKKLRRNNQLRHNNNFNNGDDVDDDALNSGYEDEDFDDMCYCDECMNVRISIFFSIISFSALFLVNLMRHYDSGLMI